MFKGILQRKFVTNSTDSKGEKTTIGEFKLYNPSNNVIFECYTAENDGLPTDESGKDKPVVPRTYKLFWNFTTVGVAKQTFTDVEFNRFKDIVPSDYHIRYSQYGFKNVGLQLWTPELNSFESRWIFIHRGNTGKDTEGCLLLGYGKNNDQITDSTTAIQDFYDLVYANFKNDANRKIMNFEIEVKDLD